MAISPPQLARSRRRVLLAWELGEGLGHAARLLWLAQGLREQGWEPVVAAREPRALAERYAAAGVTLICAPIHRSCFAGLGRFRAASYADIMGVCGYAEAQQLHSVLAAWDRVLQTQAVELIIADYAPLLSLAAFGRIPLICVGDGFVTPPALADGSFPPLGEPVSPIWAPEALLETAQRVQAARGQAQPCNLAQIIQGAGQVVSVPPELDIYGASRPQPAAGPWERPQAPLQPPPTPHLFAYLRLDQPLAQRLLQLLVERRLPAECYLRGADNTQLQALRHAGIQVHATPPPLREVLARASMLIHHGGIGSLTEALLAGRPQCLLPRQLEQQLNAQRAMACLPGMFGLRSNASSEAMGRRLPALLLDPQGRFAGAAQGAAERLGARQETAWEALLVLLAQLF